MRTGCLRPAPEPSPAPKVVTHARRQLGKQAVLDLEHRLFELKALDWTLSGGLRNGLGPRSFACQKVKAL